MKKSQFKYLKNIKNKKKFFDFSDLKFMLF